MTCYDATTRTAFTISLMNYAGVTNSQSHWRNVLFSTMQDSPTECGRIAAAGNESASEMRFSLQDADLYSFRFLAKESKSR